MRRNERRGRRLAVGMLVVVTSLAATLAAAEAQGSPGSTPSTSASAATEAPAAAEVPVATGPSGPVAEPAPVEEQRTRPGVVREEPAAVAPVEDAAPSSIEVVLDSVPDDGQDVGFQLCPTSTTGTCTGAATPFTLDDDTDPTNPRSLVSSLAPGTYRVVEDALPGWELSSISCVTGEAVDRARRRVVIDLVAGEQVTCTFENRLPGLTLVQDTQPDDPQDFATELCDATDACQTLTLDDDADPALPRSATLTTLAPGSYTLRQPAVPGFGLVGVACTDAARTTFDHTTREATITVEAGVPQTCTLVVRPTTIRVVQFTDAQPYPSSQDFHFSVCQDASCTEFDLDRDSDPTLSDQQSLCPLAAGTYVVSQPAVPGDPPVRPDCGRGEANLGTGVATFYLAPGDQVVCNFDNDPASVGVYLDSNPDSGEDVALALCPEVGDCRAAVVDDDAASTLSHGALFGALIPGRWTLTAVVPSGWAVTSLQCPRGAPDLENASIELDVDPGLDLNCNITISQASITIRHDTVPDGPQDVTYTGCAGPGGANGCGDFTLDGDPTDAALPSSLTATAVTAGVLYTITQHQVDGFGLTAISCTDGVVSLSERRVTIVLTPGQQVSCTFTLRVTSMTVVHDTTPSSAQDFPFTGCTGPGGANGCGTFLLDDDADPALPSTLVASGLTAGQEYSVRLDVPAGYGLRTLTCTTGEVDLAGGRATFVLRPGEQATCTFASRLTSLTITQDTKPDGPQDFAFTGCAGPGGANGCATFALDDDSDAQVPKSRTFLGLQPEVLYTFVQEAAEGFGVVSITCNGVAITSAPERRATVVLRPGDQVTCVFVAQATTLTIVQDTVPNDAQDFAFVGCAGPGGANGCSTFSLDDDSEATLGRSVTYAGLAAGREYTVTQLEVPGMGLSALTCTDGQTSSSARRAVVVLDPGEQVTCTFTNRPTTFRLVLATSPPTARDFVFDVCLGNRVCSSVSLDTDDDPTLSAQAVFGALPGELVTVTQRRVDGYGLQTISCTDGTGSVPQRLATVLMDPGDQTTCTFTDRPTSLTVLQDTSPSDPVDVGFTGCAGPGGANGCASFSLDDDADATLNASVTYSELSDGTVYTLTQHEVAGFALTNLTCTSGVVDLANRRVTVVLEAGEQAVCTFVTTRTQVTLTQDSSPHSGQDFTFAVCGPGAGGCTTETLDDDDDPAVPTSTVLGPLTPGTYLITQAEADRWGLTGVTCTGAGADVDQANRRVTLEIEPGAQASCRFQTTATRLTVVQQPNDNHGHEFTYSSCLEGGSCEDFTLSDNGVTGGGGRSVTFEAIAEGRYQITQEPRDGFVLTMSCGVGTVSTDGHTVTVDVPRGAWVTCVFENRATELFVEVDTTPNSTQAFSFTVCGPTQCWPMDAGEGSLGFPPTAQFYGVPAGSYTVTLDEVPPGWTLIDLSCGRGGHQDLALRRVTVTLVPGNPVFCKPVLRRPAITVVADTVANASRDLGFTFCPVGGGACTTFALDDDSDATLASSRLFAPLEPGTYTVTQDAVEDRVVTTLTCTTGEQIDLEARRATITLAPGEVTTCTFVNAVPSISVVHDAVPNAGTDVTYTFCDVATTVCSTVVLDDDTNSTRPSVATFADLEPGTYTVTSAAVAGRAVTGVACSTGEAVDLSARRVTINLAIGEGTTCTFTNTPA